MKLILGIGNPGEKYANTRHNIGFMVIDEISRKLNVTLKLETKFESFIADFVHDGEKIILIKPATYVNLSGIALSRIVNYYKVQLEDIIVIVDDINLRTGFLRLRESGGDGGHNGLKNIIDFLGSKEFKRMRVGIGLDSNIPLNNYVLGKITEVEHKIIDPMIMACRDACLEFAQGVYFLDIMTKYNSMNKDLK